MLLNKENMGRVRQEREDNLLVQHAVSEVPSWHLSEDVKRNGNVVLI